MFPSYTLIPWQHLTLVELNVSFSKKLTSPQRNIYFVLRKDLSIIIFLNF